jgi:hypothetical protein
MAAVGLLNLFIVAVCVVARLCATGCQRDCKEEHIYVPLVVHFLQHDFREVGMQVAGFIWYGHDFLRSFGLVFWSASTGVGLSCLS